MYLKNKVISFHPIYWHILALTKVKEPSNYHHGSCISGIYTLIVLNIPLLWVLHILSTMVDYATNINLLKINVKYVFPSF